LRRSPQHCDLLQHRRLIHFRGAGDVKICQKLKAGAPKRRASNHRRHEAIAIRSKQCPSRRFRPNAYIPSLAHGKQITTAALAPVGYSAVHSSSWASTCTLTFGHAPLPPDAKRRWVHVRHRLLLAGCGRPKVGWLDDSSDRWALSSGHLNCFECYARQPKEPTTAPHRSKCLVQVSRNG
jgi:hypothetical protein